jgi:hypothetical protein
MAPDLIRLPYEISDSAWVGIEYFNREQYYEAHEYLETAWRNESSVIRDLYQGILQSGICLYHARRGNLNGAIKVGDRAIHHLSTWQRYTHPLDIARLYQDLLQIQHTLIKHQTRDQNILKTLSGLVIDIHR